MEGCVCCAIVGGRAPAHRLLEDEQTVSFLNIAPATLGHALVVPRRHADGLWDLKDDEHAKVARAAGRVARLLRAALEPAGVNLVHATGVAAWQSVFTSTPMSCRAIEPTNFRSCGRRHPWPTPTWPPCAPGSSVRRADASCPGRASPEPAGLWGPCTGG